jgi:hypothetical protein
MDVLASHLSQHVLSVGPFVGWVSDGVHDYIANLSSELTASIVANFVQGQEKNQEI